MTEDIQVTLPKLGESIMNATIVKWFKKEGDTVEKDEPLLEVATDKVNSEIPSPTAGTIKTIAAKPDQEMNVGDLLVIISSEEEGAAPVQERGEKPTEKTSESQENKDYFSPAVLRIAREKGVGFDELEKIPRTGLGGRLSKKDLEAYLSSRSAPCPLEPKTPASKDVEHIKLTGMRKAIADNMVRSFYEAPHATLVAEVDVTGAMNIIKTKRDSFAEKHGAKLTITTFVARAIVRALQEYPLLNASLEEDTIVVKHFINLGIAVSVDQGIMVPVIKRCEKLTTPEIAQSVGTLAKKARENSLSPDDVKEGTVTMTNFGMSGVLIGVPIIRYPEVAIIGVGGITKRVVVVEDDLFAARQMMHISLTFDHRIIDGMYGCGFLGAVKKHLEEDLETEADS